MTDELMALLDKAQEPNPPVDVVMDSVEAAVNFCRTELPALIAEVERLREADRRKTETLKKASAWFLDYARQHDAKTPPDTVKAGTNYERAQYCETAAFDDGSPAVDAALWPELQEGQP